MAETSNKRSVLQMRIEDAPLPNRAKRWLLAGGIETVGQLTRRTEADLLTLRNFAETSLQHVKAFLAEHGLSLAPAREEHCRPEWVREAIEHPREVGLGRREIRVLKLRYGIGVDRSLTLEETGRVFDITRERVRQIQKHAEQKVLAFVTFRQ